MFHSGSGGRLSPSRAVVAAIDAAAHEDHALEFPEGRRIAFDGGLHVEQRADGDERDLAWMCANLLEQKLDPIGVFSSLAWRA